MRCVLGHTLGFNECVDECPECRKEGERQGRRIDPWEEAMEEDHDRFRVDDEYRRSKSRKALV